jgi:hypothetical protein
MALLSQEELGAQKAILSHWQSPGEFVRSVDELMPKAGSVQFFTDTDAALGGTAGSPQSCRRSALPTQLG